MSRDLLGREPTEGMIGDRATWLGDLLEAARAAKGLDAYKRELVRDLAAKFDVYGDRTFISSRQERLLREIERQLDREDEARAELDFGEPF